MSLFADVIVDISQESLDRPFQYRIPVDLAGRVGPGTAVRIPFGRGDREITGYVIGTGQTPKIAPERIKEIAGVLEGSVGVEARLIALAAGFLRFHYDPGFEDSPSREKERKAKGTDYFEPGGSGGGG